jgi:tetratricopeptide (TPR) repeat protein
MKKPSKRERPALKTGKTARAAVVPPSRETAKEVAPAAASPVQAEKFAQAAELFTVGRFAEARRLFEAASTGANREMAHSARLHVRMCEQRVAREIPAPTTAEDNYNYAVTLMNRRDFQAAQGHLEQALRLSGEADHVYYALALCRGSLGDLEGAGRHLKRAIEIHPRNRAMARNDPDFAEFARRSPISELIAAGKGGPA